MPVAESVIALMEAVSMEKNSSYSYPVTALRNEKELGRKEEPFEWGIKLHTFGDTTENKLILSNHH